MTPPIINNGVYRYIFTLLKYIDKEKFQFEFLMQNPEALMRTKEYKLYGFKIHSFSTTQRDDPQKFRREIFGILSEGFDIIELHTSYWRGFMIEEVAMELHIPKVIVHSHSSGLDNNSDEEREELIKIHEAFREEFNTSYATDFWACSKEAGKWLFGESIKLHQIKYVHNAIEVKKYSFSNEIRNRKRDELHLEKCFVIGNVGRFEYQKNQVFLIRVFKQICEIIPNSRLLLIGGGELKQELQDLCNELHISEKVIMYGFRNDVDELLQAMDVFAFPSWFEGFGITLIEAQAAGLQCIVNDNLPRESAVTENLFFVKLEIDKWVEVIIQVYYNPVPRRSFDNKIAKAGFDIRTEIKKIEEMYLE